MKRVLIESPSAGSVLENVAYAKKCVADSLARGEAPFAMHLHYPQILNDLDPEQRTQGIAAGLRWGEVAEFSAVYVDRGISHGMKLGIAHAKRFNRMIEYRSIEGKTVKEISAIVGEDQEVDEVIQFAIEKSEEKAEVQWAPGHEPDEVAE